MICNPNIEMCVLNETPKWNAMEIEIQWKMKCNEKLKFNEKWNTIKIEMQWKIKCNKKLNAMKRNIINEMQL